MDQAVSLIFKKIVNSKNSKTLESISAISSLRSKKATNQELLRYQIVEGMSQNTIKCHYINTFVILELQFLLQFTLPF
jgi:hypothetical protein